jgi:hypothetical protein
MQGWHTPYLGLRELPREFSQFELQAFFTFSRAERELIERRRGDHHKLGLALHIGFVRMSGRPLNSVRAVPVALLRHLGQTLDIATPDLASLRALYARGRTLFDHQQQACEVLGFAWMSEHQRRALVRVLRDEVAHTADRERLLLRARHWLYEHRLIIVHERAIRALVAAALTEFQAATADSIRTTVPVSTLKQWAAAVAASRPDGQHCQSWLWSAPAKHSTRQIAEALERITFLNGLGLDRYLGELNDALVRRYARRMATRPPSISERIKEPARTVEMACFLRYCLLTATDQFILMFQRRAADLWRQCADDAVAAIDWSRQYQMLLQELADLALDEAGAADLRTRLLELIAAKRAQRSPSRASGIRRQLIVGIAPVRSLLVAVSSLAWRATGDHPALQALHTLRVQYASGDKTLPVDVTAVRLGAAWRQDIADADRERAFRALEVATLFALRRAVRNGSVWVEHSLSYRGRERLFIPAERWEIEARRHYARLQMPAKAANFLAPLLERVRTGVDAVVAAVRAGTLRVDDELHLAPLPADDEDPEVSKLRSRLDQRIGEVQLPEVILAVDAQVRFSWIMLGREPRSGQELLMAYCRHPGPRHQPDSSRVRAHDPAAVGRQHPPGHALGRRRAAPGAGLPGGTGVHAGPRHRGHLGPSRPGLLGHDEPGDQPPGLAGAAGSEEADGLHRHLQPRQGSLGNLPRPADRAQRAPGRRGHRGRGATRAGRDDPACGGHARVYRLRHGLGSAAGLRPVPQAQGAQAAAPVRAARHEGARGDRRGVRGRHRHDADRGSLG